MLLVKPRSCFRVSNARGEMVPLLSENIVLDYSSSALLLNNLADSLLLSANINLSYHVISQLVISLCGVYCDTDA